MEHKILYNHQIVPKQYVRFIMIIIINVILSIVAYNHNNYWKKSVLQINVR